MARRLAELGVPVIDADILAREQTRPGMPALQEIALSLGSHMITPQGELDRLALRRLVFSDPGARDRLEAILHPRIRAAMSEQLQDQDGPYVVLVIPLLLETGQTDLADRILVVDVDEDLQLQRATRRDRQSAAQIQAIMRTQCPRNVRLAAADEVIDNNGTLDQLLQQTDEMHRRYLSLSRNLSA